MSGSHPLLKFTIFGIVCIAFAVWLVITIGNIEPFANRRQFQAVFTDATGLVENDAVKVAGVEVGKVESIEVDRGNALVTFSVDEEVELGRDTAVGIRWRNVLGLRYLYLYPAGDGDLEAHHRFGLERTISIADFGQLMQRLVPVQRALNPEVGNVVVDALADALVGREERVQRLIAEAGSLTTTLADRDEQIGRILEHGAELAAAYAEREQALRDFIDRFSDVSQTVAARNDELERIVVDLADAQSELRRFLEANDAELRGAIDELDELTAVLSLNRSNLEDVVTHLGRGLAFYHRTSRWGQWFNVRPVGASDGGHEMSSERGAELPPPQDGGGEGGAGFLRAGLTGTGGAR